MLTTIYRGLQRPHREHPNTFLSGNYAPVGKEIHVGPGRMRTLGVLPPELNGSYIRNGPNPQFLPNGGYHWFDGDGMLHATTFDDGEATAYSNHWVRGSRFELERQAGGDLYHRLGDMKGIRGLLLGILLNQLELFPPLPKHCSVWMGNAAVRAHANHVFALSEESAPFEIEVSSSGDMKSVGVCTFDGKLTHPMTAHPKVDPATGIMHTFGWRIEFAPHVLYNQISPTMELSEDVVIDVLSPSMMHDFAIVSRKWALFFDHNLVFEPKTMVTEGKLPFVMDLERPGRIGLLPLSDIKQPVRWVETEPYTFLHTVNAWEEGDLVHAVICRFERLDMDEFDKLHDRPQPPTMTRYTINTRTGEVSYKPVIPGVPLDFPTMHPKMVGRRAKYCWAAEVVGHLVCGFWKVDLLAPDGQGAVARVQFPPETWGGEMVFVPRDEDAFVRGLADEDDGFLLGYVTDERTMKSYCMVYDAKTMSNQPLARVELPQRVPYGFHGTFVPRSHMRPAPPSAEGDNSQN